MPFSLRLKEQKPLNLSVHYVCYLGNVHLVRPVDVDAVQAVAGFVSPHSYRDIVIAVKHD